MSRKAKQRGRHALVIVSALVGLFAVSGASGALLRDLTPNGVRALQEDPCKDREPTPLDKRPEWRCVGLARMHQKEPKEIDEQQMSKEDAARLDRPGPRNADWGVAVSPDGRLYVQVAPIAPRGIKTAPPSSRKRGEGVPGEAEGEIGGGFGIDSILGADDREVRLNTTDYPWRALTAVLAPGSDTSGCSGTVLGPRHVLTAGHCIHQDGAWFPNRKLAPGMSGIGNFPNGLKNHSWYYSVKGWFENADPRYDYAMIILQDLSSTASLGYFGWKSSGHSGGTWNFGYPTWWRDCADSPNPPECSNFLYGDDGVIATQNWGQLGHTSDTQPGHSGSPVYKYNNGDRRVIAIHAYGAGDTGQNWGTRIRSAVSENICDWIDTWHSSFANRPPCY